MRTSKTLKTKKNADSNNHIHKRMKTRKIITMLSNLKKFNELEMKGSYTLEKAKPKDRVSGSISIIAYFHVPEKKYIEEQIIQLLTSIKYQEISLHYNCPFSKIALH